MTQRLIEALTATREAAEKASVGDAIVLRDAVSRGAGADLCDALAMLIEPFHGIDVRLSWARTRPMKTAGETAANASLSWMLTFIKRFLPSLAPSRQPFLHADGSPAPAYRAWRRRSCGQFLAHFIASRPQERAHLVDADRVQHLPRNRLFRVVQDRIKTGFRRTRVFCIDP